MEQRVTIESPSSIKNLRQDPNAESVVCALSLPSHLLYKWWSVTKKQVRC